MVRRHSERNSTAQFQPWDRLPPVSEGDTKVELLFMEIGRALTTWEQLEEQMAELFVTLTDPRRTASDPSAMKRVYGLIGSVRGRKDAIKEAAKTRLHDSDYSDSGTDEYARILDLLTRYENFSARRNDIAHGVVRTIHELFEMVREIIGEEGDYPQAYLEMREDPTYYLVPPSHNSRHTPAVLLVGRSPGIMGSRRQAHIRRLIEEGPGAYKYSSESVRTYIGHFVQLRYEVEAYVVQLRELLRQFRW